MIMKFDFNSLSLNESGVKQLVKSFKKSGTEPVAVDVSDKAKTTLGIKYKEIAFTFADSQQVKCRVSEKGSIFQVLVNNRITPIKNQDDYDKGVVDIINVLDAGRKLFTKKLESRAMDVPTKERTSTAEMEKILTAKRDGLKDSIHSLESELSELRSAHETSAANPTEQPAAVEPEPTPEPEVENAPTYEQQPQKPEASNDPDLVTKTNGMKFIDTDPTSLEPQKETTSSDNSVFNIAKSIELLWSEESVDENIKFNDFESLQKWFKKTYPNHVVDKQGGGYSKNKLHIFLSNGNGETTKLTFRVDVSGSKGDFNPNSEDITEFLSRQPEVKNHSNIEIKNAPVEEVPEVPQQEDTAQNYKEEPIVSSEQDSNQHIIVTGNELGDFPDTEEGKKALRSAVKDHLMAMRGEWIYCPVAKSKIEIRKRGIKKSIALSGDPRKLKLLVAIKSIISGAKEYKKEVNLKLEEKTHVIGYHYLYSSVILDDKKINVRVVVEEDQEGLLHYDINLDDCVAVDSIIDPKNYSWNNEPAASSVNVSNTLDSVNGCKKIFNIFIDDDEPEYVEYDDTDNDTDTNIDARKLSKEWAESVATNAMQKGKMIKRLDAVANQIKDFLDKGCIPEKTNHYGKVGYGVTCDGNWHDLKKVDYDFAMHLLAQNQGKVAEPQQTEQLSPSKEDNDSELLQKALAQFPELNQYKVGALWFEGGELQSRSTYDIPQDLFARVEEFMNGKGGTTEQLDPQQEDTTLTTQTTSNDQGASSTVVPQEDWEGDIMRARKYAKNLMDAGIIHSNDVKSVWSSGDLLTKKIKSLLDVNTVTQPAVQVEQPAIDQEREQAKQWLHSVLGGGQEEHAASEVFADKILAIAEKYYETDSEMQKLIDDASLVQDKALQDAFLANP